ncbi:hypothetical protein CNEO3_1160002 [Clostridium neonatale]|nr:hypothetical protein CNEO3_1160002 [Clostridium neonatale]CAI3688024.1 hypothetical protein CNEO4_710006 [Clostridium neonatale]
MKKKEIVVPMLNILLKGLRKWSLETNGNNYYIAFKVGIFYKLL